MTPADAPAAEEAIEVIGGDLLEWLREGRILLGHAVVLEAKVQEKLAECEAQWRRDQEAPAPIPCSDCGHDLTKAAPGKKVTKPKKLAGDVRRAKKKAKRGVT